MAESTPTYDTGPISSGPQPEVDPPEPYTDQATNGPISGVTGKATVTISPAEDETPETD